MLFIRRKMQHFLSINKKMWLLKQNTLPCLAVCLFALASDSRGLQSWLNTLTCQQCCGLKAERPFMSSCLKKSIVPVSTIGRW